MKKYLVRADEKIKNIKPTNANIPNKNSKTASRLTNYTEMAFDDINIVSRMQMSYTLSVV